MNLRKDHYRSFTRTVRTDRLSPSRSLSSVLPPRVTLPSAPPGVGGGAGWAELREGRGTLLRQTHGARERVWLCAFARDRSLSAHPTVARRARAPSRRVRSPSAS